MSVPPALIPVLGLGWGVTAAVVASAWARRHATRRLEPPVDPRRSTRAAHRSLVPPAPPASTPPARTFGGAPLADSAGRAVASSLLAGVSALGRAVRRMVPADSSVTSGARPDDQRADRRAGWATLSGAGLLVAAPALALAPMAWAVVAPVLAARHERARLEAGLHDQLPDVVDLLALTTAAGLPVGAALVAIGDRPGGPLGVALARAAAHVRRGGSTAGAVAVLGDLGAPTRPLVDALIQHDRYGTPLLPALERVAIEARARRRRRAEEAARRLPITLLFPLVLTTFPAFVLLTVVPLLAGSLGSLSLSPT